ncbi:hypothetical protein WN66_02261 [Saccharomyces cerevisiae]|uniref:Putative uncharacterized protein YGL132W n=2 Tax=Saccharomyces cerevisiae TaxID=4932 RepID=YGN2_YEAST|nr:RecName: Full=Putative uncharacterized protein YGL132W [Saccharomyces cerevisiae S288C]KZV11096.1 hypothetical protein WN66_02261 [Saccharomyces cerevisiae]CAA96842.1 unnamed protein product [Saccharomyces cerevisiae]CAY79634.1 EC1118_1G1_1508p [Saccharomyces cerevisiae EC1118]
MEKNNTTKPRKIGPYFLSKVTITYWLDGCVFLSVPASEISISNIAGSIPSINCWVISTGKPLSLEILADALSKSSSWAPDLKLQEWQIISSYQYKLLFVPQCGQVLSKGST